MKHRAFPTLLSILGVTLILALLGLPASGLGAPRLAHAAWPEGVESSINGLPGAQFVHVATVSNINGHWSTFDHPLTNDNPNAIVLITQDWNPGGEGGVYNDHPIAAYYVGALGRWAVLNEDFGAMPQGAAFNILIPALDSSVFVHAATSGNTVANSTYIDHPQTNGKPNALLLVAQNWNPGGGGGVYNSHEIGVWYDSFNAKWAIFNQDIANMPLGADFNVQVLSSGPMAFAHTATTENTVGNWTAIDHPMANGNPDAIVHVTQSYNPGGGNGLYNDHAIGIWYNEGIGRWAIFNEDLANIPVGGAFNVVVTGARTAFFIHTATDANTTGHWTAIDHPLTNGNPHAIVLVTQNWNSGGGGGGVYNDHPIGAYWVSTIQQWAVLNQDFGAIPEGAHFDIVVPSASYSVFVHTASVDNIGANWTFIDHPLTNGHPDAFVLVTSNWNPSGTGGQYNNHEIGVFYDADDSRWAIFNQDLAAMPEGVDFNVMIPDAGPSVLLHTATPGNVYGNSTALDHPQTNDRPSAIILVTQNWNPGGAGGVYNDHATGAWYDGSRSKWSVFNQDGAGMPVGAAFNVAVFAFKTYMPLVMRGY